MTDPIPPIDWTGKKKVNLALQGGGSHGAFTWGVLDLLLEDARLDIEAITGTSAGAMNAVVLAEGYLDGGRAGARKSLAEFWQSVSDTAVLSSGERKLFDVFFFRTGRYKPILPIGGPTFSPTIQVRMISIHSTLIRCAIICSKPSISPK